MNDLDLNAHWMPFTANRQFKKNPRLLVAGEGVHYTDSEGRIVVIDESQQGIQKAFSFVTTVGLYDANEQLLAVSKLSRPVEKNDEKDLTFRVRLDF